MDAELTPSIANVSDFLTNPWFLLIPVVIFSGVTLLKQSIKQSSISIFGYPGDASVLDTPGVRVLFLWLPALLGALIVYSADPFHFGDCQLNVLIGAAQGFLSEKIYGHVKGVFPEIVVSGEDSSRSKPD